MARVLVVDDEAKLGRVVAQMLELDGHAAVRAESGRTRSHCSPRRASTSS